MQEIRATGAQSQAWRALALRCLQGDVSLFCGSITSLQAAVMVLLDAQESSLALDSILVTAISGAQRLGLHRLGEVKLRDIELSVVVPDELSPHIRTEIGIRIW